jgi:hypothetical protein
MRKGNKMAKAVIKCEAIDCDDLIYSMGRYECLQLREPVNGDICMRCKFMKLAVIEATNRQEKKHG